MNSTTLRFVRQQHDTADTLSFFFEPTAPLDFQPGQYLVYELPHANPDERGTSRAFTIASSPSESLVRLTTRVGPSPSTFKQSLLRLRPGARVEASGPHGSFVHTQPEAPAVFIAGGIGITPFRSMLSDDAARGRQPAATLLYSSSAPEFAFSDLFDGLAAASRLRVAYTLSRPAPDWHGPTGRIDAAFIQRHVADTAASRFYVCGPAAMVEAMRETLAQLGIPPERITDETFPGYDAARAALSRVTPRENSRLPRDRRAPAAQSA